MSKKVLTSDFNNLYNPIFCDLFNKTDGFMKIPNSAFKFSSRSIDPNYSFSKQNSEYLCLEKCKNDDWCTSYGFKTDGYINYNGTEANCVEYIDFPSEIIDEKGLNSGYNLSVSYPYNNLTSDQQNNIKIKCMNQYLNNTFTPTRPEINFSNCLNIQNKDSSTTNLNLDPECIYNIYNSMGVKIKTTDNGTYIDNPSYTIPEGDPAIDNYKRVLNNYTLNKNNISNINRRLTPLDSEDNENNIMIKEKNNTLYNKYIDSIKDKTESINSYSNNINRRIGLENFENEYNNNVYKNSAKFIILFIIILLLWYIILMISK